MTSITVLNGPNLNLLGTRWPVSGPGSSANTASLGDVETLCRDTGRELGFGVEFRQSDHEGVLIDWIHALGPEVKAGRSIGAVYNPGAHAHYSYSIRDAIESVELPVVEVHISNVHAGEEFRQHSVMSPVVAGLVIGCGIIGYALAIRGLVELSNALGPADG